MIKGVLFDVGGVLITLDGYYPVQLVAKFYNIDTDLANKVFNKYMAKLGNEYTGKDAEKKMWESLSSDIGSDNKEIPYFILHEDFEKRVKRNYKVLEMLEDLKDRGFIVGILSDTNIIHKEMKILQDIYSYVDILLLSCDIGVRKPKKEAFRNALKVMGLNSEEVIFIDDKIDNVKSANEMGFKTILAENEEQIVNDIKQLIKK
jgi:putative hydrolase of the HAD superfamily